MSKTVVRIENLIKTYQLGETTINALRGVNLSIKEGEFTALIGASGSGKSTLLNLLGCLDKPDSGNIYINDVNVSNLDNDELDLLRNRKLGFIFQNFNLVPVLSVFENVELPLLVQKDISKEERRMRVVQALNDVGLSDFINHMPNKLSGGQRQRAAIARSLVSNPALILADEPTANLDSDNAYKIINLMKDLNKNKNVTFLFCTHDEKIIGSVSRVICIEDGIIK